MTTKIHFDLLVIGGGLVGGSLSLALANLGLRIALIDRAPYQPNDARLFALNFHSITFLQSIGLWQHLANHASPISQVHVSHQGHFGSVSLSRADCQLPALGHVIPAIYIEKALHKAITNHSLINFFCPYTLKEVEQNHNEVTAILADKNNEQIILTAPLLIGADGTHSKVRQLFNFTIEEINHHQSALVTQTVLQRSHHHVAYERFLNEKATGRGAIAMLPLPENNAATIWTGETSFIQTLAALDEPTFLTKLQQQFGYRLGRFLANKAKFTYPLKTLFTQNISHDRIGLIGNAAHTLHPIAAQGFNLALYEITILAKLLSEMQEKQHTPQQLLTIYDQTTQAKREFITKTSLQIVSLFSSRLSGMPLALNLGFLGLEHLSFIKGKFIRQMTYQR